MMRPGREMDVRVAQEIFGHEVFVEKRLLHEKTELGNRPLRNYTKEIEWAWLVAEKMRVALVPIEGGQWFAFSGKMDGWASPEAFLESLRSGDFSEAGASVGENPALAICEAALVAAQKKRMIREAAPILDATIADKDQILQ